MVPPNPQALRSAATRWLECSAHRDRYRFAADADLDPATGIPVGDEGYYLYLLNEAANWDYSTTKSLLFSIWQRPWGHSWLILESPQGSAGMWAYR